LAQPNSGQVRSTLTTCGKRQHSLSASQETRKLAQTGELLVHGAGGNRTLTDHGPAGFRSLALSRSAAYNMLWWKWLAIPHLAGLRSPQAFRLAKSSGLVQSMQLWTESAAVRVHRLGGVHLLQLGRTLLTANWCAVLRKARQSDGCSSRCRTVLRPSCARSCRALSAIPGQRSICRSRRPATARRLAARGSR